MKNIEFENIKGELIKGEEIKIRYFTYNKNDYVDIIGKIYEDRGIYKHNTSNYFFTIKFLGILNYHNNYNKKNIPYIPIFNLKDGLYCNIFSNRIIFIKPFSMISYKIKQIKNIING